MWFIGVEVEQETSAPPPKKYPGSAPAQGSISENSYSIDCMKSSQIYKIKTRPTMNVIEFFSGPLYCCVSIKTVNDQTMSVFY